MGSRSAGAMIDRSPRGQFRGSGSYDYAATSTRGGFFQVADAGSYQNVNVKPASITAATQTVVLTGRITNFRSDVGRTVEIQGTFGRRVDPGNSDTDQRAEK